MRLITSAWWQAIAIMAVPLIKRIFIALGIGFVVYTGYQILFDQVKGYVMGSFDGLPVELVALLSIARVDDGAMMILSAMSVKLGLQVFEGSKRRMRLKA